MKLQDRVLLIGKHRIAPNTGTSTGIHPLISWFE